MNGTPVLHHLEDLLLSPLAVKDQGTWLQKEAFSKPQMLMYSTGSSELTEKRDGRVDEAFSGAPTGFEVCTVGAPGHTTLLMAAIGIGWPLGDSARGKKVAVIISPSWFRRAGPLPEQVAGCISPLQVYHYMKNPLLDEDLRHRFAGRFLAYPDALEPQPVLSAYLKNQVGRDTWGWILAPVVSASEAELKWEDHLAVGFVTAFEHPQKPEPSALPKKDGSVPWQKIIEAMEKKQEEEDKEGPPEQVRKHSLIPEDEYIASYENGKEWDDLKLLLDTMKALGMKPLIIGIPLGGNGLETHGVTRDAREHYYEHFRKACEPYGWALVDFAEHDMDPGFLFKGTSHFTEKGWMYVNWALDDFYHDRLIQAGAVHQNGKVTKGAIPMNWDAAK